MTNINLKISKIDYKLELKISNLVVIKGNYKKLNEKQLTKLKKYTNSDFKLEDILSIRSAYMSMKILKNSLRLKGLINEIYDLYNKKESLKEISEKFDLPPIPLIKNIFYFKNYSKDLVKSFFYGNNLFELNNFDLKQLKFAIKNDIFNKVDQSSQIKNSENFETEIKRFLIKNKIKFKTQNELSIEQINKYGRAINTPDFLIKSDFYINNKKINWIDAKNFYGANTYLIKKKTKSQVKKYVKEYGYGSIFFSLNFSEKLNFEDVLLVNYNMI